MRLTLLVFICFPLLVIGQENTESSLPDVTALATISIQDHRAEFFESHHSTIDFGLEHKPATVKVHPNPSSNALYVTLSGSGSTGKVIVYDILGNILVEGDTFQLIAGASTWSHNVSSWHTGTYVVRVLQDDVVVKSLRFIKN